MQKIVECRIYRRNVKACSMVWSGAIDSALAVGSEGLAVFSKVKSGQCDTQLAVDINTPRDKRSPVPMYKYRP
jgi:hypothetical protein